MKTNPQLKTEVAKWRTLSEAKPKKSNADVQILTEKDRLRFCWLSLLFFGG